MCGDVVLKVIVQLSSCCKQTTGRGVDIVAFYLQAVGGGHWILLEDIDSAAADVASVLASLVETGTLSVPGYRDCVRAAPGFQLIVTQR
jgi:AAA ATPase containing von Willebrand factor type A (vWA) domain